MASRSVVLLAVLAAALPGVAGCRPSPRPNVILVVVDTLRADRVGVTGGRPGLTPFLDALGASGVVFRNAHSTSSWTNPSVASLFTSRHPSQHQVATFDSRLADAEKTLGERLQAAGWRGMGIVANFRLTRSLGFAQGFDIWLTRLGTHEITTHQLAQDAIRQWDRRVARYFWRRVKPQFLYLHPMEPHSPYEPPEAVRRAVAGAPPPGTSETDAMAKVLDPGRWPELSPDEARYLAALYDAEIAAFDTRLRRCFRRLASRGLLDHAIVVVTADHGEEFGEHGKFLHGTALYEESIRVPLIMTGPGLPAGRVVDTPVSLVDVAPTVLELVGLAAERRFEGRSLLPLLHGGGEATDVLFELLPAGPAYDMRRHTSGLIAGGVKLLETRLPGGGQGSEVFDLRHDPGELHPDPPTVADAAVALRGRLEARRHAMAGRAGARETVAVDRATRERLRALGYAH